MCKFVVLGAVAGISVLAGQTPTPSAVVQLGYAFPAPLPVAPGQVVTLFVHGLRTNVRNPVRAPEGQAWPTSLAGISVTTGQSQPLPPAPVGEVRQFSTCSNPLVANFCGRITAVTVQVPLEIQPVCWLCQTPVAAPKFLVREETSDSTATVVDAISLADQIHVLTACDTLSSWMPIRHFNGTGLPCQPMVTHGNGSLVTAKAPAQPGEQLVAYAVGLGQTDPPAKTGEIVTAAAPAATPITLDFNYRPNALATQPVAANSTRGTAIRPLFAGSTPGYVGLYQVNFVVPPVPAGILPCVDVAGIALPGDVVQSNLTVSIGGASSFDGAGICVAPPAPEE